MDLRTLFFVGFLLQLISAAGLALMGRGVSGLSGLRWFARAFALSAAGLGLMLWAPGNWGDNLCVAGSALAMAYGFAAFAGRPARRLTVGWVALVLLAGADLGWAARQGSPDVVIVAFGLTYCLELALGASILMGIQATRERTAMRFTAGLTAAMAFLGLARALGVLLRPVPPQLLRNDPLRFSGAAVYVVFTLSMAFCLVWMTTARLRDQLERQAQLDDLTGVLNRRTLEARAGAILVRGGNPATTVSLLVLDLDHFKNINDQFGHAAGDAALQAVAGLLAGGVRAGDLLGRFGGEEFVVVLPHTPLPEAAALAQRLRRQIAALEIAHAGGLIHLTASFGAAALHAADEPWAALLLRADRALYAAKRAGRDCVWCAAAQGPVAFSGGAAQLPA